MHATEKSHRRISGSLDPNKSVVWTTSSGLNLHPGSLCRRPRALARAPEGGRWQRKTAVIFVTTV
eukprot:3387695-Pyramimonas_sp.AAC.1